MTDPSRNDPPVLEATGLAVGFGGNGDGRTLVSNISLRLPLGKIACLLGPNGAGKSTLLRTLAGLLPPKAGQIAVVGKPLADYSPAELARKRAFSSSFRGEPLEMTVWESTALGRHPHTNWAGRLQAPDKRAVMNALNIVGLFELRERRLASLSDGERQKATVARAAQGPSLLLLDEPTAFLDALRREELLFLLRKLAEAKKWACVVTTHELDLALKYSDEAWLLPTGGPLHVRSAASTTRENVMEIAFGRQIA